MMTKRNQLAAVALGVLLSAGWPGGAAGGAGTGEEDQLIGVLEGSAPVVEKSQACARLKPMATGRSLPALVRCIENDQLFQQALDVLETLPEPAVDAALQKILPSSSGQVRLGVIQVLGERRSRGSVAALRGLLAAAESPDATRAAVSAAKALGKIGGKEAVESLESALPGSQAELRRALVDALLSCASSAVAEGECENAVSIYRRFDAAAEAKHVRAAAYAGLISAAVDERQALDLIQNGLAADDPAHVTAALAGAREVFGNRRGAKQDIVARLSKMLAETPTPEKQIALIAVLEQGGDPNAVPGLMAAATNAVAEVRLAALKALGTLPWQAPASQGGKGVIRLLAQTAAQGTGVEQVAARQSLVRLPGGGAAEGMVALLEEGEPIQAELIQALASRHERQIVPQLLQIAQHRIGSARDAALHGLTALAGIEDVPGLAGLLGLAAGKNGEAIGARVREVFVAVAGRSQAKLPEPAPLLQALRQGAVEQRAFAAEIAGLFIHPDLRAALLAALKDAEKAVRLAAEEAIAASPDPELLSEKLALATKATDPRLRWVAFENYVRSAADGTMAALPAQRLEILRQAHAFCDRLRGETGAEPVAQMRLVLAMAGEIAHRDALELALQARKGEKVRVEAETAGVRIAQAMLASDPEPATRALELLAREASTPTLRTGAGAALENFFAGWLYAGPFRRDGARYDQLFDMEFPPELGETNAAWRPVPGSAGFSETGIVDLAGVVSGEQCVVYVRNCVFVPEAGPAVLQIGSDDGVKLWLDGRLAHANNVARPVVPSQDTARVELRAGWNTILGKITQNVGGCGLSLRITGVDGAPVPGQRFDARRR